MHHGETRYRLGLISTEALKRLLLPTAIRLVAVGMLGTRPRQVRTLR